MGKIKQWYEDRFYDVIAPALAEADWHPVRFAWIGLEPYEDLNERMWEDWFATNIEDVHMRLVNLMFDCYTGPDIRSGKATRTISAILWLEYYFPQLKEDRYSCEDYLPCEYIPMCYR